MKKIKVAIIGASGYTGVELIRILLNHKQVEICFLAANSNADQSIDKLYPHLTCYNLPQVVKINEVNFNQIDAVFSCLPHTTSQNIIKEIFADEKNSHLKIFDLSADFRLANIDDYQKWYHHPHQAVELQKKAVYGLTEINRDKIKKSSLIACPGCYPTSILLPLIPLLQNKLIKKTDIIIDSKSATSGAGRSVKQDILFCEVNESVKAYSVGNHRHISEIEQELTLANNEKEKIIIDFTPHLLPINRGIISTIYVKIADNFSVEDLSNCLETKYQDEPFINIVQFENSISDVVGTNFCFISVKKSRSENRAVIVSTIDNLCKGASGQAVQNFNVVFGCDEKEGLEFVPIFP